MKLLIYVCFFCSIVIDTFSQCTPTISISGTTISQTYSALPSTRVGLDYENNDLIIQGSNINISIANSDGCSSWQLSVNRNFIVWDANLRLWINKINDGSSFATGASIYPNGTSAYQEITSFSQSFFSGVKDRLSVQISYKITGMSVLIPVRTYSATVYYTISATL